MSDKVAIAISENMQAIMLGLNDVLEGIAGEPIGFSLMVFTQPRASYGSNCQREDVVREMKTLLDHWEKGMPDIPAHKVVN